MIQYAVLIDSRQHIFGGNPPINKLSQMGDLLVGGYSDHVDIVSLSATLRF
jgi:hypothetical protein